MSGFVNYTKEQSNAGSYLVSKIRLVLINSTIYLFKPETTLIATEVIELSLYLNNIQKMIKVSFSPIKRRNTGVKS